MKKDVYLEGLMLGHVLGEADGLIAGAKAAVVVGKALLKQKDVMVAVTAGLLVGSLVKATWTGEHEEG